MVKFDLGGSVMDELGKTALKKGWIKEEATNDKHIKEAAMALTPQQIQIVKSLSNLKRLDFEGALEYAQMKYPRLFSAKPLPVPAKEIAFEPKTPEWSKEKDPWDPKSWGIDVETPGVMTGKESISPDGVEVLEDIEKTVQKDYPEFNLSDDAFATTASVIDELVSLANDLDEMGEDKMSIAIDKQTKIYKEAVDKLYDVTGETGEQLVGKAHPGGGPVLFKAEEDGGKVETIVEEQKKSIEKATKQPTGKVAELMIKLVATANKLESKGDIEAAKIVDKTLSKLRKQFPFVSRSTASEMAGSDDDKISSIKKEAAGFNLIFGRKLNNIIHRIIKSKEYIDLQLFGEKTKSETLERWYNQTENALSSLADNVASEKYNPAQTFNSFKDNIYIPLRILKKQLTDDIIEDAMGMLDYGKYHEPIEQLIFKTYGELEKYKSVKEDKPKSGTGKEKLLIRYKSTLNKIIKAIDNDPEKSSKALGGDAAYKQFRDALVKETDEANKYDETALLKANRLVWNKLMLHLRRWKIKASVSKKLIKNAASLMELLEKMPEPPKTKRAPSRRSPKSKGDPKITELQTSLKNAGFPVEIDGWWGPKTAAVYNQFIEKTDNAEKYMKPVVNIARQRHADRSAIDLDIANKIVSYVASKRAGTAMSIPLGNVNIPFNALRNSRTFVEYMQPTFKLKAFPPNLAMQYLKELSDYTYSNELDLATKARGSVNKWRTQINKLNREFQTYAQQEKSAPETVTDLMDPYAKEKGFAYPWQRGAGKGRPGQTKQLGELGDSQKASAERVWTLLTKLPDRKQIKDVTMFRDLAENAGISGQAYFNNLRTQLRGVLDEWNKIKWQGMENRLGASKATRAQEFMRDYYRTMAYIQKNSSKYFTPEKAPSLSEI